jgi:hypothetical protein
MKTRRLSNGPKVAKEEKRAVDPKVRLVMKTIHENQISNQNSFVMDACLGLLPFQRLQTISSSFAW